MKPLEGIAEDCAEMRKKVQKHIAAVKKLQKTFLEGSVRFPPYPKEHYTNRLANGLAALERAENQLMAVQNLDSFPDNLKDDMSDMIF